MKCEKKCVFPFHSKIPFMLHHSASLQITLLNPATISPDPPPLMRHQTSQCKPLILSHIKTHITHSPKSLIIVSDTLLTIINEGASELR